MQRFIAAFVGYQITTTQAAYLQEPPVEHIALSQVSKGKGKTVLDCSDKQYYKINEEECKACNVFIAGCISCHRGSKCDACVENARLTNDRTCECHEGYDWDPT